MTDMTSVAVTDRVELESAIVYALLVRYGFERCRLKWMLRDIESRFVNAAVDEECAAELRQLRAVSVTDTEFEQRAWRSTFRTLPVFFQTFPVILEGCPLTVKESQVLRINKFTQSPLKTRLFAEYRARWKAEQRRRSDSTERVNDTRPFAVVFRWQSLKLKESLVLHNLVPIENSATGTYMYFRLDEGQQLMMQSLEGFLGSLDRQFPPADWQASAILDDWDRVVLPGDATTDEHW